ncbi:MAG: hypothetical protein ACI37Z_10535 [Candidatus Gastranaerophilaceae bacterium]
MKNKILRLCAEFQSVLCDKNAAMTSTEITILLIGVVVLALAVVIGINKIMGDGQSEEEGGALKKFKDAFEARQN